MTEVATPPDLHGKERANNPLIKKIHKIQESRIDSDKDLLESLKTLSSFFTENSLKSRRNLRSEIENRSLALNLQFETSLLAVKQELGLIQENVEDMNVCYNQMVSRISVSKQKTSGLIKQAFSLQNERTLVSIQSQIVAKFLERFHLKQEEVDVVTKGPALISQAFFSALQRIRHIHQDCRILLRTRHQNAGLEIMDKMALYQEAAFEKLYRWTQEEFRLLSGDYPEIPHLLPLSMEVLQERPVLFNFALTELCATRRNTMVRGFIDALTREGPAGNPRPIELHSHDPVRYTSDMLAWLHQAIAGERELLVCLLRKTKNPEDYISESLSHISEGAFRPLQVRVEQVITSEPGITVLYHLNSLIKFYIQTLRNVLSPSSQLVLALCEVQELSLGVFFASLSGYSGRLAEQVTLPSSDLGPPTFVMESLALLKSILSAHNVITVTEEEKRKDYEKIFSTLIDPLLHSVTVGASHLGAADMATYTINCLHQVQSSLATYLFTDLRTEMISAQIEAHCDTLISEEVSLVLVRTGLYPLYTAVQSPKGKLSPMSKMPGLDTTTVQQALVQFDRYLSRFGEAGLPQINLLRNTRIRDTVHRKSLDLIQLTYSDIYQALTDPANEYPEGALTLRQPVDMITLLI